MREQRQRIREQNEKRQVYMMRQKAKVEVYQRELEKQFAEMKKTDSKKAESPLPKKKSA